MGTSWEDRIKAAEAELATAEAELATEKDEISYREKLEEINEKARISRAKKRTLNMQRAVESWRDKLSVGGKKAYVDGVQIEGREDFFVVAASKGPQEALTVRVNHKQTKPADLPRIYLDYALLVVKQWHDGKEDRDTSSNASTGSMDLRRFLEENPGVVTTITQAASRLAGAHRDDSKS